MIIFCSREAQNFEFGENCKRWAAVFFHLRPLEKKKALSRKKVLTMLTLILLIFWFHPYCFDFWKTKIWPEGLKMNFTLKEVLVNSLVEFHCRWINAKNGWFTNATKEFGVFPIRTSTSRRFFSADFRLPSLKQKTGSMDDASIKRDDVCQLFLQVNCKWSCTVHMMGYQHHLLLGLIDKT